MSTPSAAKAARVLSLSGNPRAGSRTGRVAAALGAELHQRLGFPEGHHVHLDLAELPNPLATDAASTLQAALSAVSGSAVLLVATPTYKATYTGLLKAFVDLLPSAALKGVLAVPVLTLGHPGHTLAADVHLRPLLIELGATTPTAAVTLLDADLVDIEATARDRAALLSVALEPFLSRVEVPA